MPLFIVPLIALPIYAYTAYKINKAEALKKRFKVDSEGNTTVTLKPAEWSVVA